MPENLAQVITGLLHQERNGRSHNLNLIKDGEGFILSAISTTEDGDDDFVSFRMNAIDLKMFLQRMQELRLTIFPSERVRGILSPEFNRADPGSFTTNSEGT